MELVQNARGSSDFIATYMPEKIVALISEHFPERPEDILHIQIEEFLKFMIIVSGWDGSFIPLSKEIDEVWHEAILQTRFYYEFCKKLPGGKFIHHETTSLAEYVKIKGRELVVAQILSWLPIYVTHFGAFVPERARYWTICNFLEKEVGLTLSQINILAVKTARASVL